MAIALRTGSAVAWTSGLTIASGSMSLTAGDIIVCSACFNASTNNASFSKTAGTGAIGAFTTRTKITNGSLNGLTMAYAIVTTTGTVTITATSSGAVTNGVLAIEAYSGASNVKSGTGGSGSTGTTAALSITNADQDSWQAMAVSLVGNNPSVPTASTNVTSVEQSVASNITGTTNDLAIGIGAHEVATAPGSITLTMGKGNNLVYCADIVELSPNILTLSVNDSTTLSENNSPTNPFLKLAQLVPTQNDAVAVTESAQARILLTPEASDAVTVTESVTAALGAITLVVSESVTVSLLIMPAAFDGVIIAESNTVTLVGGTVNLDASVSDDVAVGESVTAALGPITLVVSESVNVSLLVMPAVFDGVSIAESNTVTIASAIESLAANVADDVAVAEAVSALLPFLNPAAQDAVSVTESAAAGIVMSAQAGDDVSVVESISALLPQLFAAALDSVSLSEDATALLPFLLASVSEAVTVSEDVTVDRAASGLLEVEAFDAVSVSEDVTVKLAQLIIAAADDVSVAELADANFVLSLAVADPVDVSESVLVLLPFLVPDAHDSVAVTEAVEALLPVLLASVFESVDVSENVATPRFESAFLLNIEVGDDVAVADGFAITGAEPQFEVAQLWANEKPKWPPLPPPMEVSVSSGQGRQTTRAQVTMSQAAVSATKNGVYCAQSQISMDLTAQASTRHGSAVRAYLSMRMHVTAKSRQQQAAYAHASMAIEAKIVSRIEPAMIPTYDGPGTPIERELPAFDIAA